MKSLQHKPVINLNYLKRLSKNNSGMMTKIIEVFLEETPQLIDAMKKSIEHNDWESLKTAAHSIRPSFSMMGINKKFETTAKEIQEYAISLSVDPSNDQINSTKSKLSDLFLKIESVCSQACEELQKELLTIKVIYS